MWLYVRAEQDREGHGSLLSDRRLLDVGRRLGSGKGHWSAVASEAAPSRPAGSQGRRLFGRGARVRERFTAKADHAALLFVAGVVGAIECEVAQGGELGLDTVEPGTVGRV